MLRCCLTTAPRAAQGALVFDGATTGAAAITLQPVDPLAAVRIFLPAASGTVCVSTTPDGILNLTDAGNLKLVSPAIAGLHALYPPQNLSYVQQVVDR